MKNKIKEYQIMQENSNNSFWNQQFGRWLIYRGFVNSNDEVIELGCGDKSLYNILRQKVKKMDAYDYPKVDCEKSLEFKSNSYDVIVLQMVVEHIVNYIQLFRECKRVLRENGRLIIMTFDASKKYKGFIGDPTHVTPFCIERLKQLGIMFSMKTLFLRHFRAIPRTWKLTYKAFDIPFPTPDILAIYIKNFRKFK